MATTRIRTIEFLPEIFQTPTNTQFLSATLDQLVNPPLTEKIEGYIGSKFGYGINAKDYYVVEPTKTRTDYQLDPGIVFTKKNEGVAQDFISYPGLLDGLKLNGAITDNNNRLFESQFYSWDSFTNLDKIINFNQYYWLPEGPPAVTVSSETVFYTADYIVTDLSNSYNIRVLGTEGGSVNPTLTLLRGGTYRFILNQDSDFWIQTEPSVSGYSLTQPNLYLRDVYGVDNNGETNGAVIFNVPQKDAQNEYNFPGNNLVDVVSTKQFLDINGKLLADLPSGIDGVTSLNGLTVMFYETGNFDELGYTQEFYDENNYDVNDDDLVAPLTITVTATDASGVITCNTTENMVVGQAMTFSGLSFGGLQAYIGSGVIYYVDSIINSTQFTVTTQLGFGAVTLTTAIGTLTGNINQGLYEEGFYSIVNKYFYEVSYIGDPNNPVLKLLPTQEIPINEKITASFGNQFINKKFYKNTNGVISLIPNITAPLDILYYQDGTNPEKVGIIKLIESNINNTINVETDILGKINYTSSTGIVFTNGLKVSFDGDVIPRSYLEGEYYVEGVGTGIELIPTTELFCPEGFTESFYTPYDILPYDIGNYDGSLYVPVRQDYITIARNSINKNAWSRSNRWFHIEVINATAAYNNTPSIVNVYGSIENKAKRPIIEFYPKLGLFNSGVAGKPAIDFIDFKTTDALSYVAGQIEYYPDVETYTTYTGILEGVTGTSTIAIIPNSDIKSSIDKPGKFQIGQYITDTRLGNATTIYPSLLPSDAKISNISQTNTHTTLTISWSESASFTTITNVGFVANDKQNSAYALFGGARIVFANDNNVNVRNKIYVANFSNTDFSIPVITLTEAPEGECLPSDQTVVIRGFNNEGKTFYYNGINWILGQQKITVNQPPLFDVYDQNNISFGNSEVYQGTTFKGCKLFAYGIGSGADDPILSFPIRYSNIENTGDISFDVSLNIDTFDYVTGTDPETKKVNTGYVYNYTTRDIPVRNLGWQTATGPSVQYQVFNFDYFVSTPNLTFVCDIAKINDNDSNWPTVQVYINNVLQSSNNYFVTVGNNTTTVTLNTIIDVDTVIQILLLSNQVSKTAYYQIPTNLNNNPLNQDLLTANIGDIRSHYQSIFANNARMQGQVFGSNNYRDLGNVVPYGNKIIQNSASLVLPGTFIRKQNHNLFDALLFNSREYVKFKTLLMNTVNNSDYSQRYDPAYILDDALDQLSTSKNQTQAFFWSDMLPSKAPYISNIYSFKNDLDVSNYPLSRVYDFSSANYYGVLVYLSRTILGTVVQKQLVKDVDYKVSEDSRSLTVTIPLQPGDKITVKEYNQTYGSYVPNTPTKLGLYPAFIPTVILDNNYNQPTYFIRGHDGSYNKLYGEYNETLGVLVDFKDQALLEFETRIYNNLKLSTEIPVREYEVVPGFFRESTYSYSEFLQIYSESFLNWIGQNRLNYKNQYYNKNDEFTFNYSLSGNKLNNQPIEQGYWRGIYQYMYDTSSPDIMPWEMIGLANKPDWWEERYGPAPYTSDNLILWNDLAEGINWNNGDPYVIPELVRPGLLKVIPVDSEGNLLSPLAAVVGNYNSNIFQRDWNVGDDGPVELSYRRSSTWPFDLMRITALTKPARFFNLGVDLDNYKYSEEFNQYLVNNRSHLILDNIEIYGNGTAKTSYVNWIVDFEKQLGLNATDNIKELLFNLDVRLVYRLAGFSDKSLLKFYVEKGTPNSNNASLLIPDESYSVLLYDNQPYNKITYSGVVVQLTEGSFKVFGNSQNIAYFKVLDPIYDGYSEKIKVEDVEVKIAKNYSTTETAVPYGAAFYSVQEVSQFLASYGAYLESNGLIFDTIEYGLEVNWNQMIAEFLYWAQIGWEDGSVITLNPAARQLKIDKESTIVQPLTIQQTNFILNQNLYPIQISDLNILREGTLFTAIPLNQGDTVSYAQFNLSNFEHGIVFDNITLFNDIIYNLITGLRQIRITVRGTKTAEWNGTINASGFILNQDNIKEWQRELKYTKGQIVKYKNRYWSALKIIQPSNLFKEADWKIVDYDQIQKGLLPNSSTRSYESTLYYNSDVANLEQDSDLLSYSLIGYRPRDYLALVDLTDITQINVYKNLIRNKGTRNAVEAFKGANLPQGGIDYEVYENWAIKSGEFGGVLNNNFIEFRVNQAKLTANPATVLLTDGYASGNVQEIIPLYRLFNYGRPVNNPYVLSTIPTNAPSKTFQDAGYVNLNDVKMSAYFFNNLVEAVNKTGQVIPITKFYSGDYVWLASYLSNWQVYGLSQLGQVLSVQQATNTQAIVTFAQPHQLERFQPFAIINFNANINGYYIVDAVLNDTSVLINYIFDVLQSPVTGYGIALKLQSHRVETTTDINNLPLLDSEFRKNTVWVDEAQDGGWAVYRKGINYTFYKELTKPLSGTFGSAVAYSEKFNYLISDSDLGKVYRYSLNYFTKNLEITQTLTGENSFGSKIVCVDNLLFISKPTGSTPYVAIYTINDTILSDAIINYQIISAPYGINNWGHSIAVSGDKNWLYISDTDNNFVYVYNRQEIEMSAYNINSGLTYIITEVGDTDWESIGAIESKIGITFVATGTGSGTGKAKNINYIYSTIISSPGLIGGDKFGNSISTDYNGDIVVVTAPNVDYNRNTDNLGRGFIYQRVSQNFEAQLSNSGENPVTFNLCWQPNVQQVEIIETDSVSNLLTCSETTLLVPNTPIVFVGDTISTLITPYKVYYINTVWNQTQFTIKESLNDSTPYVVDTATGLSINGYIQITPLTVTTNGLSVNNNQYAVIGSTFYYHKELNAGDIINVNANKFTLIQTLNPNDAETIGTQFGYSSDANNQAVDILIGAPFDLSTSIQEGAVYRFTNGGAKYGTITGTGFCNITSSRILLINGYSVSLPKGNAQKVADAINQTNITNIIASATTDNKIVISVLNKDIAVVNEKLVLGVVETATLTELGIQLYTQTQVITCPHVVGPTQFGNCIKFNELGSVVISAPVGTRFLGTTFDFTDDENLDNDTVFDNNSTQFVDTSPNCGAVYMYDYIPVYNESISNPGQFVYAQSVNNLNLAYGFNPRYGEALDFTNGKVIIGTPKFLPDDIDGQVIIYENLIGSQDWSVFRKSAPIVDINKVENIQLFSAETNNTLANLDYIDPLQGKLLGAVRQNIDFISTIDPARYNSPGAESDDTLTPNLSSGFIWGAKQVGSIWFDTTNVKFINYHQNDSIDYNASYWGSVFPGSDVAIYTWISSNVTPSEYIAEGLPGTPYNQELYTIQNVINASNVIQPVYFFWVRNSNIVFKQEGKTLADTTLESYILNPKSSGISYFAPLLQNSFGLYNSGQYLNGNDTVLHIGYSTGTNDDVPHTEYELIRENYADDFLPGLPNEILTHGDDANVHGNTPGVNKRPISLYDRLLDSLSGSDEAGNVVPNPWLPKAVQSGVMARPRQSFFYNRLTGLKNYLTYANEILLQYPIAEIRREASFLFAKNEFYNTRDYWEYVNWWVTGYDNNTKSVMQVPIYADLSSLNVPINTIVTVAENGDGKFEVYRFDGNGLWTRIGLQSGTIQFKLYLWDYEAGKLGFGDNFFDTTVFDLYPSEETRFIVRALNEQIYIDELLIHRNKSLILLFEYIQSEALESQNYAPWLNKTSLVDVAHTIRELRPIEVFQSDNQDFLAGYINEVKPYHVVIKEFIFKYTGEEILTAAPTDFDLPATYNSEYQQFISPEYVTRNPSQINQYLPTDDIWQNSSYNQWFQNKGLSISGPIEKELTILSSYLTLRTSFMIVDNAQGFPINGVIRLGKESIAYSYVDRSLNILSGLTRGYNNTEIVDHFPGENIFVNLPGVIVLNGGRGYTEPPKITVYINEELYGAPTRPAQLQAVMSLDSVNSISILDSGQGYMSIPEIRIAPSTTVLFSSNSVNTTTNTITLYAPTLQTGDLIQYKKGITGVTIGGLVDDQWYYINLLETTPTTIVALYESYGDAVNDRHRIKLYTKGTGTDHTLNLGAKATVVTTSTPTRENNLTLRFDRTTYNSQIIEWESGQYYGAFFAGDYSNSEKISSSGISLQSTQPPIQDILSSAQGAAFEIVSVADEEVLTWSSFVRIVGSTIALGNIVRLTPFNGLNDPNTSGSTIGFYKGMPIKFVGNIPDPIIADKTYYVLDIINTTDFTIAESEIDVDLNIQVTGFTNVSIPSTAGAKLFTGETQNTAIITINYPGILTVTAGEAITNKLTVPISAIGTGGTNNFYIGLPVFFVSGGFDGIIENQAYYVTTIIDSQTFTISEKETPVLTTVIDTEAVTNYVIVDSTAGFTNGDPIIFSGETFGGIIQGNLYYVYNIVSETELQISTTPDGISGAVLLSTDSGNCYLINQKDTVKLTTQTGSMVMNVSLPISPGQINGQQFTFYKTSEQYANIFDGEIGNLITRGLKATLGDGTITGANKIAITSDSQGTNNFYVNIPIRFTNTPFGSGLAVNTTYYVTEYTGMEDPLNPTEYIPSLKTEVYNTTSSGNLLNCDTTENLYVGMPIIFSAQSLGGIIIGDEYFVHSIVSATSFKISDSLSGPVKTLTTANGIMIGTGGSYIKVSTSPGGPEVVLNYVKDDFDLVQFPSSSELVPMPPVFSISYILGGYRAIISYPGYGFAINNTITITGNQLGGVSPTNDLTLTVNDIGSLGEITSVICSGVPSEEKNSYYLKVISPTELKVYSDPLMQIPVSGFGFPYTGFTTSTATEINASTNTITLSGVVFYVNDPIVFTGNVFSDEIELGKTYYVYDVIDAYTIQITETPGGSLYTFTTTVSGLMTVGKAGSFILLPEPFYFTPSIIKFNNRVYVCIISNNDTEFILGKWELLDSGDRRLNALDRVIGYYQPTVNMPGVDLTQLFTGVTYPNPTYLGNPFAPIQQFELDTILQGDKFYPTDIDLVSICYNGSNYLAVANATTYSLTLGSATGTSWSMAKLTNVPIGVTSIIRANGYFVATSTNSATPIFKSVDGVTWSTVSYLAPDLIPLNSVALSLNNVTYNNGKWVAVGKNILTSDNNGVTWTERYVLNSEFVNNLFGITGCELISDDEIQFAGYISVGKGQNSQNNENIILISNDGISWNKVPTISYNGLYSIAHNSNIAVAVGENGIIYYTPTGLNWFAVNETKAVSISQYNILNINSIADLAVNDEVRFTKSFDIILENVSYFVKEVISSSQIKLTDGIGNPVIVLQEAAFIPTDTFMYKYPQFATLKNITYANSIFMAVGNYGRIVTSVDGLTWVEQSSGVSQNLNGLVYVSGTNTWTVVGDDNLILQSTDNGITWENTSNLIVAPNVYEIEGAPFEYGYGPEELVPGNVTDNLQMIVNTRPGTNWPVTVYQHTGYNVVSYEKEPTSIYQTTYSWKGNVLAPAQLSVFKIDGTTGLSTTLYDGIDFTTDWVNQTVTLNTPLAFSPVADKLRIDVYEVGNGNQLVKSNTKTDPIRFNDTTGFNEIYLNCNYSDTIFNGSGVIRPDSVGLEVIVTETLAYNNTIICENVNNFVINYPIVFHGSTFGGIIEDTIYYVKSISFINNAITISASVGGPILVLTNATGLMTAVIESGNGLVWTEPVVEHNGSKLIFGKTNNVIRTRSFNNAITTNYTIDLVVNNSIVFSNSIFGGITPLQTYYIKSIIDNNEFTISETIGGPELTLTDAVGSAIFITNDYAFAQISNSTQAKIVFAAQYDNTVDYIVYSVFGETEPEQYGYTLPETQIFQGDGSESEFNLTYYVGDKNPINAIVEIDGVRQTFAKYTIYSTTNTILFDSPPANNSTIAVTTYNNTDRQYFSTQYGITGQAGSSFIQLTIQSTNNDEIPYDMGPYDDGLFDQELNWLTCDPSSSTIALNINDPIVFSSPTLDGIIPGISYYIIEIWNSQEFVISDQVGGDPVTLSNDSGSMSGAVNGLTVSNIINIDNSLSAPLAITYTNVTEVTLNIPAGSFVIGKSYKISFVGTTDFTLIGASSNDVGVSFTATGIGSGTGTADLYEIIVDNSDGFVVGQPIQFKGASIGGVSTSGIVYFVYSVYIDMVPPVPVHYVTICDEYQSIVETTNAIGNMMTIVGGVPAVRVTTGINHNLNTDDRVRIDGTQGSIELNENVYYVHKISNTQVDLYTEPYNPTIYAVNYPVTTISAYTSGGYMWVDFLFVVACAEVYSTTSGTNIVNVNSTSDLVVDTPIIFTAVGTNIGDDIFSTSNIIAGTTYYITELTAAEFNAGTNEFVVGTAYTITFVGDTDFTSIGAVSNTIGEIFVATATGVLGTTGKATAYGIRISENRYGEQLALGTDVGNAKLSQWEQHNVDRLWVTVDGYRVPSSKLKLYDYNNLGILTTIQSGQEVIITSMIPTSTPDQEVYMLNINQIQEPSVYRANTLTRTWLTEPLFELDDIIHVNDVSDLTNTIIQSVITPTPSLSDEKYRIGINADKDLITDITVYNNNISRLGYINDSNFEIVIESLSPILLIKQGSYIQTGDSLTITTTEGNTIIINGEQIKFAVADEANNTLSGLQRGANNTGMQPYIPTYATVYGLLSENKLKDLDYNKTWNSKVYNTVEGDPLQISLTESAKFLYTDVT